MSENTDLFNLLRKIYLKPNQSQRDLASDLGFSLGKLNYCLQALKKKGFIKIVNFSKKENKLRYIKKYVLTSKGINYRISLTVKYMKRKMKEYEELKKEVHNKFAR
tara:strand:- start:212 stop:529 length:318 start_codon:yes stop_codon:yes gene_type:complete